MLRVLVHRWVNFRLTELAFLLQSHDSCLELGVFILELGIRLLKPGDLVLELSILVSDLDEAFLKLKVLLRDLIHGGGLGVHDLVDFVPLKICLRTRTDEPALIDTVTIIVHLNLLLLWAQIFALLHCLRLHT